MAARRPAAFAAFIGLACCIAASRHIAPEDYPDFYTNARVIRETDAWQKKYPELITLDEVGRSFENREIRAVRITHKVGSPAMVLMAGIHPREQPPTVCAMRFVDELLNAYGKDDEVTRLLNTRELWLIPVLNVDGKEY
ncbi:MAG: M14 family zinc carboxypeptidase, partial [Chthonomonadales bacterium]